MKIIFTSFDKKAIGNLPRILFPGKVVVVDKPEDTETAVNELLSHEVVGVDTETRPAFRRGQGYMVSLLQASTRDTCYLFRLHLTGMTPAIIRLLEDTVVPKIGLSWHDDLMQLHKRAQFKPGYFIELQDVAKKFGIKDMSLQKLYANLFHQKISKAQRLSNWEAPELKESQRLYAATDAWCCIRLYDEFRRLKETGDYELDEFEAV